MNKWIIMLLCISGIYAQRVYASHPVGGEFSYKWLGGNVYELKFVYFEHCNSIPPYDSINVCCQSNSLSTNFTKKLPLTGNGVDTLSNTCQPGLNACNNISAGIPGFLVCTYLDTVILNAAPDWVFTTSVISRTGTMNLSGTGMLYVEGTLNNSQFGFNNSVQFPFPVQLVYNMGQNYTINIGGIDPDGDSLVYEMINPLDGTCGGTPINLNYATPYSLQQPFGSPVFTLNSTNGNLNFTMPSVGGFYITLRVKEYRNGTLIGSVIRDWPFSAINVSGTNNLPDIMGASMNNIYTVHVCPNSTLNINLNSTDPDITDSTFLFWDSTISNANFTVSPAQNESAVFSWSPDTSDVRPQPYIVTFGVKDNFCPVYGAKTYAYQIYVNQCNPDSVWAGDANADFTCNSYDVLNVGMANGATGPIRIGATTNWQAEWCTNWTNSFPSSINYKHADCNGDGIVNASDLNAVNLNYGSVHFKTSRIGQYKTRGLPDLYCDVSNVQAHIGSTVDIPMMLGTANSSMNNIYGIAAKVELLNADCSSNISVSNPQSWLATSANGFLFNQTLQANKVDFAIVRNNQQQTSGNGQIGTIQFPISATSVVGSKVIIQFSDIRLVNANGEEIIDYNALQDTLTILAPDAVNDFGMPDKINLYPNPVTDVLQIDLHKVSESNVRIEIFDPLGKCLDIKDYTPDGTNQIIYHTQQLAAGTYFLKIYSDHFVVRKMVIRK